MTILKQKKLLVVGEAKSGKSTLINGILGIELLPTNILQCTNNIIELNFLDEYSIDLTLIDGSKVTLLGFENVKNILDTVGAVNEKYRGLPINILEQFLFDRKGDFEESELLQLLTNVQSQNYLNYPLGNYELKIRGFLVANKNNWNKKVVMMKVNGPFPNKFIHNIILIDTPGIGAEGDLGTIAFQCIEDADIILLVKSITGVAVESATFKLLVDKLTEEYSNKEIILALTRSANLNFEDISRVVNHASKVFPIINSDFIVAVDSKAQHYFKLFEDMDFANIKGEIMLEMQSRNLESFIFSSLIRSENKQQFLENLKLLSNFAQLEEVILKSLYLF